ncbi:hypothetical protein [Algibacter lectus]|uniref:Uncharacterized protein n=1 Tax=Algibacter lectus TaxID=221126 RepID=A0A4R8M713_9FLAO|nr:hypothetical protein [Algibacter lectus]MWW25892.1 hypothetical protein [Algibacter lectus]TDY60618.1 hypothetical protein DFQ06_3198 [Algibacter lectus]
MKSTINFILFLGALTVVSCKKENTFNDYKFSEKGSVITCNNQNTALINEALFSFEADIAVFYAQNGQENVPNAYGQFLRAASINRIKYEDIVSPHTVKVFEALKHVNDLWDANNPDSHLNYKGDLLECISSNLKDKKLKTTYDALVATNSMKPELFGTPLARNYRAAASDKNLAAYIALDLYYAKLFGIDLSNVKEKTVVEQKVDFNKRPTK